METNTNSNSAPTGCFKCGRPGHWSRDCPSSSTPTNLNPSSSSASPFISNNKNNNNSAAGSSAGDSAGTAAKIKPKRASRPKLTPELLLSDDGIGFVLKYFPRGFRYRGRGHEVSDLRNLIKLYGEWHSHLIPYYSFDQFVHKVEQVAATKRVKTCIKELRERVARGGDVTKLHEHPTESDAPNEEQAVDATNFDELSERPVGSSSMNIDADDDHEAMLNDFFDKATDHEPSRSQALFDEMVSTSEKELPTNGSNIARTSKDVEISAEQKARIEANRLKAIERAKANEVRITEEQKARMEANRLKALERAAAARARTSGPGEE